MRPARQASSSQRVANIADGTVARAHSTIVGLTALLHSRARQASASGLRWTAASPSCRGPRRSSTPYAGQGKRHTVALPNSASAPRAEQHSLILTAQVYFLFLHGLKF